MCQDAFDYGMSPVQWLSMIGCVIFLALFEGYYGFHKAFSPMMVSRRWLNNYTDSYEHNIIVCLFICLLLSMIALIDEFRHTCSQVFPFCLLYSFHLISYPHPSWCGHITVVLLYPLYIFALVWAPWQRLVRSWLGKHSVSGVISCCLLTLFLVLSLLSLIWWDSSLLYGVKTHRCSITSLSCLLNSIECMYWMYNVCMYIYIYICV